MVQMLDLELCTFTFTFFKHSFILHRLESRTRPILTPYDDRCRWNSNLRTPACESPALPLCYGPLPLPLPSCLIYFHETHWTLLYPMIQYCLCIETQCYCLGESDSLFFCLESKEAYHSKYVSRNPEWKLYSVQNGNDLTLGETQLTLGVCTHWNWLQEKYENRTHILHT